MKKIYTTTVINTGGRHGESHSADQSFRVTIVPPGTKGEGTTNPEQLFAAGYSACFNSALDYVKKSAGVNGASTIEATVSLYNLSQSDLPDVQLGVVLSGHIEGISLTESQALLEKAHEVCPYSRATMGNIDVTIKAI